MGHEAVSLARPRAQQRARVARIDDLLDAEALGRPERRADRVEPRLDLRAQGDGSSAASRSRRYAASSPPAIGSEPQSPDGHA